MLVSNTGQNGEPADTTVNRRPGQDLHSQGFETGSNLAGYSLASVGVYVSDADLAAGETFTVHIYTADGSGGLDALAYTLTSPNTYKPNAHINPAGLAQRLYPTAEHSGAGREHCLLIDVVSSEAG